MSAIGLHRVLAPAGVLPQAAERLDATPALRSDDEVRIRVERLNLDTASFRQLSGHAALALDLVRTDPGVRALFDARLAAD